jgi:DHA2 family multidrug resistance protein
VAEAEAHAAAATPGNGTLLPALHGAPLLLVTMAIGAATFMEILDMTIVNVSVPAISGSLAVSPNEGTWAISSYSLAAAIMQPLTGSLARRLGEVRLFVLCIGLFVFFSAFCGLSTSMSMLVFGRLMQGLVSGPMIPMAQTLLLRNYEPSKRGMAMGLWAMVVIVAPVFGPIIGGWVTDNFSWPWIFYINVPIGALAGLAIWSILHKRDSKTSRVPVDFVGLGLLIAGVGSLQFLLDNGNDKDWFNSQTIVIAAVVAVVCITFLVGWELTDKHPVVDFTLLRHRNFRVGVIAIFLGFFGFFGVTVIFPLWLQTTLGYTATTAGLATAPVGLIGVFLMPFIGRNLDRMNLRVASTFAFLMFGFSMLWMARLNQDATFLQFFWPRLWMGLGLAFFFLPLTQILMSEIPPDHIAEAAGFSSFLRTIGGSISTAVSVWIWSRRTDSHYALLAEHIQGPNWSAYVQQLGHLGIAGLGSLGFASNVLLQQARTLAANDLYRLFGYMFLVLMPVVWLARPPFRSAGGPGSGH